MIVRKTKDRLVHVTLSEREAEVLSDFLFALPWPEHGVSRVNTLHALRLALVEVER